MLELLPKNLLSHWLELFHIESWYSAPVSADDEYKPFTSSCRVMSDVNFYCLIFSTTIDPLSGVHCRIHREFYVHMPCIVVGI